MGLTRDEDGKIGLLCLHVHGHRAGHGVWPKPMADGVGYQNLDLIPAPLPQLVQSSGLASIVRRWIALLDIPTVSALAQIQRPGRTR